MNLRQKNIGEIKQDLGSYYSVNKVSGLSIYVKMKSFLEDSKKSDFSSDTDFIYNLISGKFKTSKSLKLLYKEELSLNVYNSRKEPTFFLTEEELLSFIKSKVKQCLDFYIHNYQKEIEEYSNNNFSIASKILKQFIKKKVDFILKNQEKNFDIHDLLIIVSNKLPEHNKCYIPDNYEQFVEKHNFTLYLVQNNAKIITKNAQIESIYIDNYCLVIELYINNWLSTILYSLNGQSINSQQYNLSLNSFFDMEGAIILQKRIASDCLLYMVNQKQTLEKQSVDIQNEIKEIEEDILYLKDIVKEEE